MATWPVFLVIVILTAGFAALALALVLSVRQLVRWHRRHRAVAAGLARRAEVSAPASTAVFAAQPPAQPLRPAVPPAPPSSLMPPAVPGRHAIGQAGSVDTETVRLTAVPGPQRPVQPPERGHRAAGPDRPANVARTSDSGGHRAHHGRDGMVAGTRLTTRR